MLQFLAGAALQLEGLLRAGKLPVAAKVRLMGLRQALGDEQRELRAFINAMRPTRPNEAPQALDLAAELEDLADHCRTQLASYKAPKQVFFVDEIVRAPSGKPDYPWAKKFASEAATATA